MKKYILSVLTIIFLSHFSFAQIQSGEVIYKVKDDINIKKAMDTVNSKTGGFVKIWFTKIKKAVPYLSYSLKFNQNASVFQMSNTMAKDNGPDLKSVSASIAADGIFYTNNKKKLKLRQLKYLDKNRLVKIRFNDLDWHITDETKVIKGYVCRKATAKANPYLVRSGKIIAWFCPKLPFQFGPISYNGLPGLILGLKQNHYYFYANKINLSKKDKKIKQPTKGKQVKLKQFVEQARKLEYKMKRRVAGE